MKRLSEASNFCKFPRSKNNSDVIVSKLHKKGPIIGEIDGKQYQRVHFLSWNLSIFPPNNCVFLKDGSVLIIENFVEADESLKVVGRKFLNKCPFYNNPKNAAKVLNTYSVSTESELRIWPLHEVFCKAFCMHLPEEHDEGSEIDDPFSHFDEVQTKDYLRMELELHNFLLLFHFYTDVLNTMMKSNCKTLIKAIHLSHVHCTKTFS